MAERPAILERIVDATRARVADLRSRRAAVLERAEASPAPPSFERAITSSGLAVIAEIKRRSPSKGDLAPDLDPAAIAVTYANAGAAALSVLTEPNFFNGRPEDLVAASEATGLPTLRKDFVLEAVQIWEARAMGAAAVLLVVSVLTPAELASLLSDAAKAGVDALVEVHDAEEARLATDLGARIIGVNNRDLASFEVDLKVAEELAPLVAGAAATVAESGVSSGDQARRMRQAGYDAVLVGEALVTSADPGALIRELRS
ncbi:MAG TPA: indole-3-glycerol phosphate synthase TrpC [Acidimicrobiia bacterium]|jgi:indole-3-glycerol phosphate synthase